MPSAVHLGYCTCPDLASAESLAESLIEGGLAACVNILPGLTSIYRWQGTLTKEAEVLLLIKTTEARVPELAAHIQERHPYDVPEVLFHPIVAGLDSYLEWVRICTNKSA